MAAIILMQLAGYGEPQVSAMAGMLTLGAVEAPVPIMVQRRLCRA